MSRVQKQSNTRFLYCPWRIGPTLTILRHLIVKEGPKRITVQSTPFEHHGEEFHRTQPLVYVKRDHLEQQGYVPNCTLPELTVVRRVGS